MSSYKFTHLTLDDRISIQKALKEGKTFLEIATLIARDPTTISKEVKGHSLSLKTWKNIRIMLWLKWIPWKGREIRLKCY